MSKMPAKKKSCFQITSVTQAQVAASSATDDTESLDDPDETRTEDVSSEIYDVSRTHFEHELCNRTFSEEISNNVGEYETGQTPLARPPPTDSVKVVPSFRVITNSVTNTSHLSPTTSVSAAQMSATAVTGISQHPVIHQSIGTANLSFNSSQIASTTSSGLSATTTTTSCSSRFRVIKLDHGIGEPFRRGRWTCTEFYEKDPEGTVISRNVDAIGLRHNSTLELGTDRDSGLGTTGGSTAAPSGLSGHGPDAGTEVATPAVPHANHLDLQQQAYSAGQQQHHPVSSSLTHEAYSNSNNSKPMTSQQQTQAASHPPLPQNLIPGLNDPQHTMYMPKSPGVPSGLQQPLLYQNQVAQQQPPGSAHPGSIGHQLMSSQTSLPQAGAQCAGYSEQHPLVTTTQMNSRVNLSMGQAVNLAPVPTPAKPVQGLSTSCEVVGDLPGAPTTSTSMPASVSTHLQQQPVTTNGMGNASASVLLVASAQLTPMNQYPTSGGSSSHLPPSAPSSNAQNVPPVSSMAGSLSTPASSISTIVPLASNTGPPSIRLSALQQQQQPQPLPPQQPLGVCSSTAGVSGVPSHPTASTRGLADESQRKTDVISHFPIVSGKDHPPKALIPESLKLAHPTVNSLFGIPIHIDGDEDSASGASFVAIDNKIEQAMDLVKSHLMYAVREEVEVLKEQIKELYERNSVLERENAVLKSLANSDQLSQLSVQSSKVTATSSLGQLSGAQALGTKSTSTSQAALLEMGRSIATPPLQPNVTSA